MKKIRQSFVEIVAGEPSKEHYLNVSIALAVISLTVGLLLILTFTFFNIGK
jgi:hypothetical protein